MDPSTLPTLDATAQLEEARKAGKLLPLPLAPGREEPLYPVVPNDVFDRQR